MAGRWLGMVPGMGLLRQAYDATRLAGAIMRTKKERALVLAEERHKQMAQYQDKKANQKLKELFEEKKYEEVLKLYVPATVVKAGKDLVDFWWKVWDIYWIFVLLRVVMVFMPQSGYIHPDEFFQSVEVITGDILGTDTVRTWEFNVTYPIRSVSTAFVVYGVPLTLLRLLDYVFHFMTGWTIIGPRLIFLLPRMIMLTLSFVVDWCIYQICILYKHNFNQCLTTLASSYVMLIYATRTFSNTIELVLASILIYLVAHCMKRTSETVYLQSMVHDAYEKAATIKEKVTIQKKNKLIPGHNFKHVIPISVICAVGFFNRPTFVVFAVVPLFYWFLRGVSTHSFLTPFQMFNFRVLAIAPGFFVTCFVIFLADSLYYGELTLLKLWNLEMDWTDWKPTPLHFIMYNMAPENLDKHGTHPLYLHVLVNIPLLFGPLGIAAIYSAVNYVSEILTNDWRCKPSVINVYALTMFTFIVGLGALSLIPHQEPRFLIPLTLPIVLMNAHKLRAWRTASKLKPWLIVWYVFNISFVVFYGFVHQGGVPAVVSHIAKDQVFAAQTTDANFVFSHVYMPPKFPLLQISEQNLASRRERRDGEWDFPSFYRKPLNVRIHFRDLAGKSIEDDVKSELLDLASQARAKKSRIENFIVLPSHLVDTLEDCTSGTLTLKLETRIFPHMSTESLPGMMDPFLPLIHFEGKLTTSLFFSTFMSFATDVLDLIGQFSLSVYKFELVESVNVVELKSNNYTQPTPVRVSVGGRSSRARTTK